MQLDPALRKVHRGEREIKLSPKEFDLLHLLMRYAGQTVSRQELLRQAWGVGPETDSNLVDVYVNYLRKKVDREGEEKLIQTVRGSGYRLGPPAPIQQKPMAGSHRGEPASIAKSNGAGAVLSPQAINVQQTPLRALVNSVAHDLAQPLTSVRCFLEVMAMRQGEGPLAETDLKNIEQQADRAIALAKTVASLVREMPVPAEPWTSLNTLLDELFGDVAVLVHSGLLTVERNADASIKVTSSPVLRQLLVLFIGKLVGRNTRPLVLSVSAAVKGHRCGLELKWRAADGGQVQDGSSVLNKDLMYIQELVYSIGAELNLPQGSSELDLQLPAAPQANPKETTA